jgi:ABC-type antimicrobial peptide transport system permease subunit
VGADKKQLLLQFLSETVLFALIALVIAMAACLCNTSLIQPAIRKRSAY